ncbi:MAG: toprim domain-containing protein [Clostridia bacterium]|nr:toprim domain-containing protein [Clostridia bacterium]
MSYVSPEMIAQARTVDLFSFLQAHEPGELVPCKGGAYCTASHDSLKISNGKWFWFSRGFGGSSALDYLVKVRNMDFTDAVNCVNGVAAMPAFSSIPKQTVKKYDHICLPRFNFACKTVKPYLLSRGIDEGIVDYFIRKRQIAEADKNGYALFFGKDDAGNILQCSIRATDGNPDKWDAGGSNRAYSFQLRAEKEPQTLRLFESAIDLMSFLTLEKQAGHKLDGIYLSLSGVYKPRGRLEDTKISVALERCLEKYPIKRIELHLDSDEAGRLAAKGMMAVLGECYEMRYRPPPFGKDYNEYLQRKNEQEKGAKTAGKNVR